MKRRGSRTRLISMAACASLLASCQTMSLPPALPNGTISAMDANNTQLRSRLALVAAPFPRIPHYVASTQCLYRSWYSDLNGRKFETRFTLQMRPVRERLLITMLEGTRASTALIGRDGQLFDFNTISPDGRRWTSESYQAQASQERAARTQQGYAGAEVINSLSVTFPQYSQNAWNVGDAIAIIFTADNKEWATYIYRGLVRHNGANAAVIDLVRHLDTAPVTVGFSIVDVATMAPLLNVVDAGYKSAIERISCP